jgi:hypothetical protein
MAARKSAKKEMQNETSLEITDMDENSTPFVDSPENEDNLDDLMNDNDNENGDVPFADDVYIKDSDITESKRRGAKPGYIREAIDPDFELKFNLDIVHWINNFEDDPRKLPSNDELAELPGIGQNFIRRLRNHGINLHGDLYKCALIADKMGINLIGEKEPGQRFCDNALFVKVPRKKSE